LELSNQNFLNIRDLVISAFKTDIDLENLKINVLYKLKKSLPDLAKAIYRQEQAL
jgi:hypothetical protein